MAATAHAQGWHVDPFPMDSPLMPFLFVIKRRLVKVVVEQVEGGDVVAGIVWVHTKNWMSCMVKGVETVLVPPEQYSTSRRRNNNAIWARSEFSLSRREPPWATYSMQWRIENGSGRTLSGGVFFLVCCRLSSQVKVDGEHRVESLVSPPPHNRGDMSHGSDVLLHTSLVDGLVVSIQDACIDLVIEDM